jgi:hypothetical protein
MLLEAHGACPTILALAQVSRHHVPYVVTMTKKGTASWGRILEILNVNSFLLDWTDFWGRNDPDMLEVSLPPQRTRLSIEAYIRRSATVSRSNKSTPTLRFGRL